MSRWTAIAMIVFIVGLAACSRPSPIHQEWDFPAGRLSSTDKNVVIPKKVVHFLEEYYLHHYHHEYPKTEIADNELLIRIPRRTLKLKVALASHNPEVLNGSAVFEVGRGGGVLDLAEWVSGIRGDFHLAVQVMAEEGLDPKKVKVFFVSRAPATEIEGQRWGMGCGSFAEVTTFYHKVLSDKGLRLNSTGNRYLYAATGTFVFAVGAGENLHLTSFSITDSRYQHSLCPTPLKVHEEEES